MLALSVSPRSNDGSVRAVEIPADLEALRGLLGLPGRALAAVLFAHGRGSGRLSPRNFRVATHLRRAGLATLLLDLQTPGEDRQDAARFDLGLFARRLLAATTWTGKHAETQNLRVGFFGSGTGAAVALAAAAECGPAVGAVVARGGRPDLAGALLDRVFTPTLLIVGGEDHAVIQSNEEAYDRLPGPKQLIRIPGATHLFEEPGALEQAADLAAAWFKRFLATEPTG